MLRCRSRTLLQHQIEGPVLGAGVSSRLLRRQRASRGASRGAGLASRVKSPVGRQVPAGRERRRHQRHCAGICTRWCGKDRHDLQAVVAMDALTPLERKALDVALAGASPWLQSLRLQVPRLKVVSRRYTGFGFFTDFACEECVASTEPQPSGPDGVPVAWAAHPQVESGGQGAISFNVFVHDGVIACLEAASTSTWPSTEDQITFCA